MSNSQPAITMYDVPMWKSIEEHRLALQRCTCCSRFRYPPSPVCPHCLGLDSEWVPISGRAKIYSWVVFHRRYFDDYPPPYNAVAVELEEGPLVVTNLTGPEPEGNWIGAPVAFCYEVHNGRTLPRVRKKPAPG